MNKLIDKHNRVVDYIRIAVTDKCNLRCFYCMPNEGIDFVKQNQLMSYEELLRVASILSKQGVSKVRITGGEPFLRKDIMYFIKSLSEIKGIDKIAITTNGTHTLKYLDELINYGIKSFNLSIDSIDKQRFFDITRRDLFDTVWNCFEEMSKRDISLKLNAVVIKNRNIEDLIPMVDLTKDKNVSVRFIEEMPFNGTGANYEGLEWNYKKILQHIESHFGKATKLEDEKNSTSLNYKIRGHAGSFGIIPAYSRTFCGTCNRIRLTPMGIIKTCLYDEGIFNVRDLMRAGANDTQLLEAIQSAIGQKYKDGFVAESKRKNLPNISESMTTIGG